MWHLPSGSPAYQATVAHCTIGVTTEDSGELREAPTVLLKISILGGPHPRAPEDPSFFCDLSKALLLFRPQFPHMCHGQWTWSSVCKALPASLPLCRWALLSPTPQVPHPPTLGIMSTRDGGQGQGGALGALGPLLLVELQTEPGSMGPS